MFITLVCCLLPAVCHCGLRWHAHYCKWSVEEFIVYFTEAYKIIQPHYCLWDVVEERLKCILITLHYFIPNEINNSFLRFTKLWFLQNMKCKAFIIYLPAHSKSQFYNGLGGEIVYSVDCCCLIESFNLILV